MPAAFRVLSTAAFDRSLKRLAKKHPDIPDVFDELLAVLEADPLNISRRQNVKKLVNVEPGDGAWRIRRLSAAQFLTDSVRMLQFECGYY